MLKEIPEWPTTRRPAALVHDDYFDLFVCRPAARVTLIQLCYGADAQSAPWYGTGNVVSSETAARLTGGDCGFEDAAALLPETCAAKYGKNARIRRPRLAVLSGEALPARLLAALGR